MERLNTRTLFTRDCKNILRAYADRKINDVERENLFRMAEMRIREDSEQLNMFDNKQQARAA
jgi:hypothetical protein